MALSSKDTKLSHSFKERLEQLSCPYTESVEESWILEFLLTPGEPRIRLLQWLLSRFNSKLNDLLDPQHAPPDTKMDSRIQRLLFVCSNLGLCNHDEADLIRGVLQGPRQIAFLDTLLDLVCIADAADSPNDWSIPRSGMSASSYKNLGDQFSADCEFIDTLLCRQSIQQTFKSEVNLLLPDIAKQIEINRQEGKYSDKDRQTPTHLHLVDEACGLEKILQKQTEILKEIKKMHQCPDKDTRLKATVKQTLRLVLSEFDQLITSFSCCFDNDMKHWCARTSPRLNEIGPCFKRIHGALQQFLMMITGIQTARSLIAMCTDVIDNIARIRKELAQLSERQSHLHGSKDVHLEGLLNSLKSSVNILEDTILRAETSFASGSSVLNASSFNS